MANPQTEDGHLKIADSLVVAICRSDFTSVHMKILFAIMNMTYRVGKTKAEISHDDLRYATNVKTYLIQRAFGELVDRKVIFVQRLSNGLRLVGIQKDHDMWLQKMGTAINSSLLVTSNSTTRSALQKISNHRPKGNAATPPGKVLTWMLSELNVELGLGAWRKEYSKMVDLYTQALDLAHEPRKALEALRDYFDYLDDPNFRARVKHPASYMLAGFANWYKQLPKKKPRSVLEDEETTGYRHKYDLKSKQWVMTRTKNR